ncbi:MAG TPA: aminotransferase class III-fold pyridoxal phosphate-dependent enzyme [Pyrinomonadaceae bacterium]|jgi:4-aminobutyrate aminotransferase-like enzyme/Ser/Thr protein kinase RdoA (MazF antagonist)
MITAVQKAPRITSDGAVRIAAKLYGLRVSAEPLPSERDQNFRLRLITSREESPSSLTPSPCLHPEGEEKKSGYGPEPSSADEQFVLKIANAEEAFEFLELQNQLIRFLAARKIELEFARIVPTKTAADIAKIKDENGSEHFVRLLTWLDGVCLAEVKPHGRRLLASLGRSLAQTDAALAEFDHPATHRFFYWDLRNANIARELTGLLPPSRRKLVERFFGEWEKIDWSSLRFSVIHNDANDYNVLVDESEQRVNAVLDYGDVVYSATVCNLAVALAYLMLDKPDPIGAAGQVVAAYHETYPLTGREIDVLYALAVTRLCCSVCYAAKQTGCAPDNEYLNISNAPAWALLDRLSDIAGDWPTRVFRYACGLPVVSEKYARQRRPPADLIEERKRHTGPSLSISYQSPLHIVSGSRQYLYDSAGRRYLDCVNNVAHVGHSHPYVVRAASEQMAMLNTNTRYLHENLIEYAERLTATLPEPLSVVYLVCSGSEANELALRLARGHTGRNDAIVVEGAYHGNTSAMIDLSPYKFDGPGGRGCPSWVHKVPMPDVYRGAHRGAGAGKFYAADVAEAVRQGGDVAAFFCESALGCGGQIILPLEYLREAFAAVRAAGGVCVADEVQTGFGRAGEYFWMFETQDVVPDIVTLGKPIGNGHPLGAVITTPEIAASFANGMEYFNTFGGNPVSCATGLAVLNVIRDEELQLNALEVGEYLKAGVRELQDRHALIGDVRGAGLFLGIELVRDRETLEPADSEAAHVVERMKERGILLSTDGPLHNVIKIKPPLVFSRVNADLLIASLDSLLKEDSAVLRSRNGRNKKARRFSGPAF